MQMVAVTIACVSPSPVDWETMTNSNEQVTELGHYMARDFNLWRLNLKDIPGKELSVTWVQSFNHSEVSLFWKCGGGVGN